LIPEGVTMEERILVMFVEERILEELAGFRSQRMEQTCRLFKKIYCG
jgi:hypothetical protein